MAISVNTLVAGVSLPAVEYSWANRPTASAVPIGTEIIVNDIPAGGRSRWYSDGTNWRVFAPVVLAKKTNTNITQASGTTIAQVADQIIGVVGPVPAGVLYAGATFMLRASVGRDVNTDAYGTSMTLRMGTTGGFGDNTISSANLSSTFPAAAGSLSTGYETGQLMLTTTSCAKIGTANAGPSWALLGSSAAISAASPVVDITTNAWYISISTTMATAVIGRPLTGYIDLVLLPN
jgi:hypothetical protein